MTNAENRAGFTKPNLTERVLNRIVGAMVKLGIGPGYMYTLEVVGRKSGRVYGTPVDLMEEGGRNYIVAPRGNTQWVRNARASGTFTLRRGSRAFPCTFRELADDEKGSLLREYLSRYQRAVQQFFPVSPDADLAAFESLAPRYPVFEVEGAPR